MRIGIEKGSLLSKNDSFQVRFHIANYPLSLIYIGHRYYEYKHKWDKNSIGFKGIKYNT
jgi:hypothetical protein